MLGSAYNCRFLLCGDQGCQIFLGTRYRKRKNAPNDHKIYQMALYVIYQIAIKYYYIISQSTAIGKLDQNAASQGCQIFHTTTYQNG
jgi:hypothetical protein